MSAYLYYPLTFKKPLNLLMSERIIIGTTYCTECLVFRVVMETAAFFFPARTSTSNDSTVLSFQISAFLVFQHTWSILNTIQTKRHFHIFLAFRKKCLIVYTSLSPDTCIFVKIKSNKNCFISEYSIGAWSIWTVS